MIKTNGIIIIELPYSNYIFLILEPHCNPLETAFKTSYYSVFYLILQA